MYSIAGINKSYKYVRNHYLKLLPIYVRMYIHTYTHRYRYTHAYTHRYIHTHTHMLTHIHMHTHTLWIQIHRHRHRHTRIHTYIFTDHTHTHTHTHTTHTHNTHTYTHMFVILERGDYELLIWSTTKQSTYLQDFQKVWKLSNFRIFKALSTVLTLSLTNMAYLMSYRANNFLSTLAYSITWAACLLIPSVICSASCRDTSRYMEEAASVEEAITVKCCQTKKKIYNINNLHHTWLDLQKPTKWAQKMFLLHHNLMTIYTDKTKFLLPMQNLMGFLLQVTETGYHNHNKRY